MNTTPTKLLCSTLTVIAALAAVLLLLLALSTRATVAQGATILYVDADATGGTPDGLSWTTAFTNVQDALAEANGNPATNYEIWVAEGVYYPDQGAGTIADSPTMSFALRYNNVRLYGGFDPGAGADTWGERDWDLYPTILSGDIDANDWNTDTNHIAEVYSDTVGTNAYHVLYLDGVNAGEITTATVLDGFTITAGQANGANPPDDAGGGLYCDGSGSGNACSPALANLTFAGNWAVSGGGMVNDGTDGGISSSVLVNVTFAGNWAGYGGGMYNDGYAGTSSPALTNVTFAGNQAGNYGGGMLNFGPVGSSSPTLTDVTFTGNQADYGGGMYNMGADGGSSSPALTNVTFVGNQAIRGGGMYNDGAMGGTSSPVLANVTFSGNQADLNGGGMTNWSSGASSTSSPILTGVTFIDNQAGSDGGGMVNSSSDDGTCSPVLANVTFSGNQADWYGGGMYNEGSSGGSGSPALANVTFSGNRAGWYGGGMANYVMGDADSGSPVLVNVTFSGNRADVSGGGVYNEGSAGGTSSPTLANVILWGNSASSGPQIYNRSVVTLGVSYSLVQGGIGGSGIYNDGVATVIDGGGNIDADPQFVHPITATVAPTTSGDYRLLDTSPAIDAGDNDVVTVSTDLDGRSRRIDHPHADTGNGGAPIVDMGAYETPDTPPVAVIAGAPYSGDEGSAIALDGSASSDPDTGDAVVLYEWDCTADGVYDTTSITATGSTCIYPDDGTYTLRLRVTDSVSGTGTATATVTISNVAPQVDAGADLTGAARVPVAFTGVFTDPGTLDTHTMVWDFGDGVTETGTLTPTHTFAPGTYTVTLTVTDDDGGEKSDTLTATIEKFHIYLPLVIRSN